VKKLFASLGIAALLAVGVFVGLPKPAAANFSCGTMHYRSQSQAASYIFSYPDQQYHWMQFIIQIDSDDAGICYQVWSLVYMTDASPLWDAHSANIRIWDSGGNWLGGYQGCNANNYSWTCESQLLVFPGRGIWTDNYLSGDQSTNFNPNLVRQYIWTKYGPGE